MSNLEGMRLPFLLHKQEPVTLIRTTVYVYSEILISPDLTVVQDEDWTEEEQTNQGFRTDEFAFLSDMLGHKGMAFDNDEILDDNDDEDLKNDPISQIDLQVSPNS